MTEAAKKPKRPYSFNVDKGPFQDNGASPWFTPIKLGTDPALPPMKLNFDTGARFIWATSTECNTGACTMPGRVRFDPNTSPTFSWIDQNEVMIDFGPWGTMLAKVGLDQLGAPLPGLGVNFYVTTFYEGTQFAELNWDGGLGIPTGRDPDPRSSNLIQRMLEASLIDPREATISFYTDPTTKTGTISVGQFDETLVVPESEIQIPFAPYLAGLEYIWTTPLGYWKVGDVDVAVDKMFCHNSGSSQFKGDVSIMLSAIDEVNRQLGETGRYPNLSLEFGTDRSGNPGRFTLTSDEYVTLIEAGEGEGNYTININPLAGLDNLVLVGSILMDYVYTIYTWEVSGTWPYYTLGPGTVRMFNKRNGPQIIQNRAQ